VIIKIAGLAKGKPMIRMGILSLALLALIGTMPASAQFAWDDYEPSTLGDVFAIGENECREKDQNSFGIATGKQAFRVTASWDGETREISQDVLEVLLLYEDIRRPGLTKQIAFIDMFKTEVRVTDSGREFWLPVQEHILEAFKKEVEPVRRSGSMFSISDVVRKIPQRLQLPSTNFRQPGPKNHSPRLSLRHSPA